MADYDNMLGHEWERIAKRHYANAKRAYSDQAIHSADNPYKQVISHDFSSEIALGTLAASIAAFTQLRRSANKLEDMVGDGR